MSYLYDPHIHIKIWLSNNPDMFMNLENQIRLIEMREKNPSDCIHLVYDSSLLTPNAIKELFLFCKEHHIIPLNAHLIADQLQSTNELQLYEFYKEEIYNLNNGGNLGVASDILRWLPPIFKYGTYTDFDYPIDTTHLPSTIEVQAPLLLNIGSLKMGKKEFILANNDFIAIVDEVAAKKQIDQVQRGILVRLSHYDTDFVEKIENEFTGDKFFYRHLLKLMKNRSESLYIAKSKQLNSPNKDNSSLKVRSYIYKVTTEQSKFLDFNKIAATETHEQVIKRLRKELKAQLNLTKYIFFRKEYDAIRHALKQNDELFLAYLMKKECDLYLKSIVVCTSGPIEISNALFHSYVVDVETFKKTIQPHSFNHYGLRQAFQSPNAIPLHESIFGMLRFLGVDDGQLNDSSWLNHGKNLQASRAMRLAARQKELALSLPQAFVSIQNNINLQLQYISTNSVTYQNQDALKLILSCFNQEDNDFNIIYFKKILPTIQLYKKDIDTKKLINELEKMCHEAIVFNLARDKKIKLGAIYNLPIANPREY